MRLGARVLATLALVSAVVAPHTALTTDAQATLASASIDPSQAGYTISPTFMGFSHEWNVGSPQTLGASDYLLGSPSSGTNPIYRQLIENLLAYGAGPFVV